MNIEPEDDEYEQISKSQRKREAEEIRQLAAQLVSATPQKLKRLSLPAKVLEAIEACPPPQTRGAHKRHIQYIGKLLRQTGEVDELNRLLDDSPATKPKAPNPHETFCTQLIGSFTEHADTLRVEYPNVNLQQARQLARAAQAVEINEAEELSDAQKAAIKKAKKAGKSLLRLLTDNQSE